MIVFFNDTATTEIYTLSLHDALPISDRPFGFAVHSRGRQRRNQQSRFRSCPPNGFAPRNRSAPERSEEHTSELQSRLHLVCRLLLEKKKNRTGPSFPCLVRCQCYYAK